jgi:hypothetical protein
MASQGPLYPGTVTTAAVSTESANDWLTPGNISADDNAEAQITAATYDSPDISYRLIGSNFGFSTSGTINGITVEIQRRSIIANSGADFRVQLQDDTGALVGTNKAITGTNWPTTLTTQTYGGIADTWTASPTPTIVNSSSFGVVLSVSAKIANADIGVDFIRVTVEYTAATNETVTPTTATLTTTPNAPTVSITDNQSVTPTTAALATSPFSPTITVSDYQTVTPTTVALTTVTFAPTVAIESTGTTVAPGVVSLSTATFAPTVTPSDHQSVTPTIASLTTSTSVPTVTATNHQTVVPSPASLSLVSFIPSVVATDPQLVTPSTASLSLTGFAPVIAAGVTVTTEAGSLTTTLFAPTVSISENQFLIPAAATLSTSGFAPDVLVEGGLVVTPGPGVLTLRTYRPNLDPGVLGTVIAIGMRATMTSTNATGQSLTAVSDVSGSIRPLDIP